MTNSVEDLEIVEINEISEDSDGVGQALPDYHYLQKNGYIKINPDTGLPDNPVTPTRKFVKRTRHKDGTHTDEIKTAYKDEHVKALDSVWRVGLNAELFFKYLEQEHSLRLRGRNEEIAPTLDEEEFEDFKKWLKKNKDFDMDEMETNINELIAEMKEIHKEKRKEKIQLAASQPSQEVAKKGPGRPKQTVDLTIDEDS